MKKVFRIQTTCHPNAESWQDGQLHEWLVNVLKQIARETMRSDDQSMQGAIVDVIVEVLE